MQQSMFVYNTDWHGNKTFRMLPIDLKCPFNEVIYDPTTKVLAIVSKESKDKPHMFPRLDEKGSVIIKKGVPATEDGKPPLAEQRVIMDTYYEYYIDTPEDIREFVDYFANNSKHPSLKVLDK
jgi:hypothetical protein